MPIESRTDLLIAQSRRLLVHLLIVHVEPAFESRETVQMILDHFDLHNDRGDQVFELRFGFASGLHQMDVAFHRLDDVVEPTCKHLLGETQCETGGRVERDVRRQRSA